MYCTLPGSSKISVVLTVSSGSSEISFGSSPVVRLGPRTVAIVEGSLADQPLVLDRVLVDQHEGDRHAVRHGERRLLELRVMDGDLQRDRLAARDPTAARGRHQGGGQQRPR